MSKQNKKKQIDIEKINELKKDIEEFSEKSIQENEQIINSNIYRQVLVRNFRNIIVINTILIIILLIALFFITGENILQYDSEYFEGFYVVFLLVIFDFGLSFVISSFNKLLKKTYKKKSFWIGIRIFLLVFCLAFLSYWKDSYEYSKKGVSEDNVQIETTLEE